MEGFDRAQYDEILDLNCQGYASTVIATVGYRAQPTNTRTRQRSVSRRNRFSPAFELNVSWWLLPAEANGPLNDLEMMGCSRPHRRAVSASFALTRWETITHPQPRDSPTSLGQNPFCRVATTRGIQAERNPSHVGRLGREALLDESKCIIITLKNNQSAFVAFVVDRLNIFHASID